MIRWRFLIHPPRIIHALSVIAAAGLIGLLLYYGVAITGLYLDQANEVLLWICFALPWFLLVGAIGAMWKKISYPIIISLIGVSGVFLIYLGWDDATRPPEPTIGGVESNDSKSYTTYRWLVRDDPHNRLSELQKNRPDIPHFPSARLEWADFVAANRAEFEAAWEHDSLGREWIDAMAANPPAALFPPLLVDTPGLTFNVIRRSCMIRWGIAQLRMLDGETDSAAKLLLPLLRASYHLQLGGSALVTQMIAVVCLRGTYDRLEIILESKALSPKMRGEIAVTLREAPSIQRSIKNAFLGEQILARSSIDLMKKDQTAAAKTLASSLGASLASNRYVWSLFFNPHRTEREYSKFLDDACLLAQQRQLEKSARAALEFEARATARRVKNPVGQLLTSMALPAFEKVLAAFWKAEDQRVALLSRLASAQELGSSFFEYIDRFDTFLTADERRPSEWLPTGKFAKSKARSKCRPEGRGVPTSRDQRGSPGTVRPDTSNLYSVNL